MIKSTRGCFCWQCGKNLNWHTSTYIRLNSLPQPSPWVVGLMADPMGAWNSSIGSAHSHCGLCQQCQQDSEELLPLFLMAALPLVIFCERHGRIALWVLFYPPLTDKGLWYYYLKNMNCSLMRRQYFRYSSMASSLEWFFISDHYSIIHIILDLVTNTYFPFQNHKWFPRIILWDWHQLVLLQRDFVPINTR